MDKLIRGVVIAGVGLAVVALMVETFFPNVAALVKAYIFHLQKS